MMKFKNLLSGFALALTIAGLPLAAARADTLYDGTSLITGQSSFTKSFTVTSPGTVTVTLTDIPWLDSVSGLTSFLSTAKGVVGTGTSAGAGTQMYDVDAGTVYAHWFGQAQGAYDLGVLGVNISFQAISSVPVSLPTSLILMLSGLGLLFGWQSRKAPSAGLATG